MTVSLVECPPTKVKAASVPRKPAMRPLQLAVQVLLAGGQPAGRDAGAVAVDGRLGGRRHRRVARHAHVIVAGEVDQFAAVDDGAVVGDPLVDAEIRIAHARRRQHVQPLAELRGTRGTEFEVVGLGGNLRRRAGAPAGAGSTAQILLHGVDDLPGGLQLGQDFRGEAAAEALLQRSEDLHPLQRVHARLDDRRIERQAGGALLGHAVDLFQHQFRELFFLAGRPRAVLGGVHRLPRAPRAGGGRRLLGRFAGLGHAPRRHATGPPRPACRRGSPGGRHAAGSCRWRSWGCCPP